MKFWEIRLLFYITNMFYLKLNLYKNVYTHHYKTQVSPQSTLSPSGLTGPAFWWWLSPASPGSAAAERRRHRGLPSPGRGPGRYLCPEAARRAGTVETENSHFSTGQIIKITVISTYHLQTN